jgi:hypothetical protein
MDVFHKVLARIYEVSGGRETHEVDFIELLKKEGFFANRDSIKDHLSTEGWITDSPRPNHVKITHWGMAEAKKTLSGTDPSSDDLGPQLERLKTAVRDLSSRIDTIGAAPNKKSVSAIEDGLTDINRLLAEIKNSL